MILCLTLLVLNNSAVWELDLKIMGSNYWPLIYDMHP